MIKIMISHNTDFNFKFYISSLFDVIVVVDMSRFCLNVVAVPVMFLGSWGVRLFVFGFGVYSTRVSSNTYLLKIICKRE